MQGMKSNSPLNTPPRHKLTYLHLFLDLQSVGLKNIFQIHNLKRILQKDTKLYEEN